MEPKIIQIIKKKKINQLSVKTRIRMTKKQQLAHTMHHIEFTYSLVDDWMLMKKLKDDQSCQSYLQ